MNCYAGHGARDLILPGGYNAQYSDVRWPTWALPLSECQRACEQRTSEFGCTGIVFRVTGGVGLRGGELAPSKVGTCYLRTGNLHTPSCDHNADGYYTYSLFPEPPSPPPTPPVPPSQPPVPPPSPPPPVGPAGSLNEINRRFVDGDASNDFALAGLFVHQSDDQDEWGEPWAPQLAGRYADRMAGSVINSKLPYSFSSSAVGFILDAYRMPDSIIRCAYHGDGNSMNTEPGGCDWGQAHDRWHLQDMMWRSNGYPYCSRCGCACCGDITPDDRNGCRYNEIVFDGHVWRESLPALIEAVWYPVNAIVHVVQGDKGRAWRVRDAFAARYPGRELPVFEYDLRRAESGQSPFAESVRGW